ncbi:MAG: hypothetical protein N3A02_07175, partial [Rectinema sp.]|nr:hypothetical protein [Rectinema sp.]
MWRTSSPVPNNSASSAFPVAPYHDVIHLSFVPVGFTPLALACIELMFVSNVVEQANCAGGRMRGRRTCDEWSDPPADFGQVLFDRTDPAVNARRFYQ